MLPEGGFQTDTLPAREREVAGQPRDKGSRVGPLLFRGITLVQHGFDSRWGRQILFAINGLQWRFFVHARCTQIHLRLFAMSTSAPLVTLAYLSVLRASVCPR